VAVNGPEGYERPGAGLGPELNAHLDDETGQPVPTPPAFTGPTPRRW
jgi:hypothetical protein